MLSDIIEVILIRLGFKANPTLNPAFRSKSRKVHLTVFIALILHFIFSPKLFGTACLIQAISGLPCPTCGSTRAFVNLIQGRWAKAFYWHPLILLSLAILLFVLGIILKQDLRQLRNFRAGKKIYVPSEKKKYWLIFVPIFVLYFGVYVYRLIHLYPAAPMNYNSASIWGRIYAWVKNFL